MAEFTNKKSLGQNFLKDENVAVQMVDSLKINDADHVIEVGGGLGFVTKYLVKEPNLSKLDVYEIDERAVNMLNERFGRCRGVKILKENILDARICEDFDASYKVIGAIPYYITSPIIHHLLNVRNRPTKIVLLIQKEVADKLISKVPRANYWSYITAGYNVLKVMDVSAELFDPAPKVDSSVLLFEKTENLTENIPFRKWSGFLHKAYKNPRKMLNKAFDKELLKSVGINPQDRPQNVNLEEWIKLYKKAL